MEFRILGPLEVSDEGRRVEIGGHKQRTLLAVLLLHANEVVSSDRLIDELWGEEPPSAAAKTLRAHVSRLRKALNGEDGAPRRASGALETRGHGYLLKVEPGQLDADRFQGLLEEARQARARGEPGEAAEELRQALALWRGPALADFAYDSFAQAEIARLDELQLTALEERIEADLALGRHAELVGELEGLVARHPLRERLRGQLMLALYHSGRQAEALQVFQQGRLALASELGLEPSQGLQRLERQILEQDPTLAPPARKEQVRLVPAPVRRHRHLALVAGALVVAAAVTAALTQLGRNGREEAIKGSSVRVLDSRTGESLDAITLGTAPWSVTVGEGGVWVLDSDDRTVSQIDPKGRTVRRTFSIASTPTQLAAGAGALWIGNGGDFASFPVSVSRVDPELGVVDEPIDLPGGRVHGYFGPGLRQQLIAATNDAVWAVDPDRTVSRIDRRTRRVVARIEDVSAEAIAAGEGQVWIVDGEGVAEIDPRTNAVSRSISVAAESLSELAVGAGAVWITDPAGGSVWRVEADPKPLLRQIPLEVGVEGISFGEGAVWVTNEIAGEVYRINPSTNRARVVSRMTAPRGVAVGQGGVWVTSAGRASGAETLPASSCGDVVYGGAGKPRFLFVSDLPLQGDFRVSTVAMVEAIRFVLERRGFRAGRFAVGYQSCDDSTAAAGGYDPSKCFANAKAYARTPDVIGVIGTNNSGCSLVEIPIANQAPGGPLAMISPSNTITALTRPGPGTDAEELDALYPTGKRNFVRIAAADHLQAVALVEVARELRLNRLFLTWDGHDDMYAAGLAADLRQAARNLHLVVKGSAAWNPDARDFTHLASRIATARPQAVLIAGAAPPHVGALVRDLRSELGTNVALIASDGFAGTSGPAARGMYVSYYGLPNAELAPKGKEFLEEFGAARGGGPGPDLSAAYGAQAAEILLDAIARSDGSRPSVTREVRRTTVEDGILGNIRFDRYGDLVEGPFTIFRVGRKGPVVDRVITVRASQSGAR